MYYTYCSKTVTCPRWDIAVTLSGKYRLADDSFSAYFINAKCPIVENSKLPLSKQEPDLKLLRCPHADNTCELLSSFSKVIDITKET